MNKSLVYLLVLLLACNSVPKNDASFEPEDFLPQLIPAGQLAHGGILSEDGSQYFLTLSDSNFQHFNVMMSENKNGNWSELRPAFFNSSYDEHGVSLSPDQQSLYFSSTRPIPDNSLPQTWQIWRSYKIDDNWSEPQWVELPSISAQLVSHPSLTHSGRMYFHAGTPDYSELSLYYADQVNGEFSKPKKVDFTTHLEGLLITPHVFADESHLLFGLVANEKETLYLSKNDGGRWQTPIKLSDVINDNNKANPFLSTDAKYLYYASGDFNASGKPKDWRIKRILWKGIPDSVRFSKN